MGSALPDLLSLPTAECDAGAQSLQRYLRLLWNLHPPLHVDAEIPFIDGHSIHLVPTDAGSSWLLQRAAAAHAAAHLVYSPPVFDGRGLGPIVRALMGLLEDARVEALACRELPGLRRLWQPLHTAVPQDGDGVEALMGRLARALLDPGFQDPHPWVAKGRALFYLDAAQQVMALQRPEQLRHAASLLGHDIGQMRLGFNARLYRPGPAYRDDHRWMWPSPEAEEPVAARPVPEATPVGKARDVGPQTPSWVPAAARVVRHPEWDRLIARLRPQWSTVIEEAGPGLPGSATTPAPAAISGRRSTLTSAVERAFRAVTGAGAVRWRHRGDGEHVDLDALLRARVALRLRVPVDGRVYRRPQRVPGRGRVLVLIDRSASSADPWEAPGHSRLQAACEAAHLLAQAAQAAGLRARVDAFCSNGRHAVQMWRLKDLDEPGGAALQARLRQLTPLGSTRLGAALRHAAAALGQRDGNSRLVLLLSDGQAHDLDVHDPRYLAEDARHAVRRASRQGLTMACLALDKHGMQAACRVFGAQRVGAFTAMHGLPGLLRRLAR